MTRISGADNIRNMRAAVEAVAERQPGLTKPTLKRYSWSRLHAGLLDDNRWSLVAKRAGAPLPLVEALIVRLEAFANASQPRGHIGDFNAEAMAARWGVDDELVIRVFEELERADIGWIDQEQLVTFWDRNPDKIDETAAERMQRMRDRKKGMKQLAAMARQGLISEAQRAERETALRNNRDPRAIIASWAAEPDALRRNAVTVTPRAEQIIKQDAPGNAEGAAAPDALSVPLERVPFADKGKALQWLRVEGEAVIARRMSVMRSKASRLIERWSVTLCHDVTALAEIILATSATAAQGTAFEQLVVTQVARRAADNIGPSLPLPPVAIKGALHERKRG